MGVLIVGAARELIGLAHCVWQSGSPWLPIAKKSPSGVLVTAGATNEVKGLPLSLASMLNDGHQSEDSLKQPSNYDTR